MRFPEALYYALKIRKKYPEYLICGSVALILTNKIPVRDVTDIDFVTNRRHVDFKMLKACCDYEPTKNDRYECYTVYNRNGREGEWHYNLFVFDDDVELRRNRVVIDTEVQNIEDILKYKRKYNRPKDKKDIKNLRE